METKAKTNKRILNTRAAIDDAFKEMIASTSANAISVQDLTLKAGIHRKTFYSHYASIEDLYDHTLAQTSKASSTRSMSSSPWSTCATRPASFSIISLARSLTWKRSFATAPTAITAR